MYYLKARYYTATLGRFLTRDTLFELKNNSININQYVYCENNSLLYIDPKGQYAQFILWIAGRVIWFLVWYAIDYGHPRGWNWKHFGLGLGKTLIQAAIEAGVGALFKGSTIVVTRIAQALKGKRALTAVGFMSNLKSKATLELMAKIISNIK